MSKESKVSQDESNQGQVSKEPEKKGLTVLNAIGGHLKRNKAGKESFFDKELGVSWDTSDEVSINFVKQIEAKFARKNKLYNYFKLSTEVSSQNVASELTKLSQAEINFDVFSEFILDALVTSATKKAGTSLSDAYVVIVHYKTVSDEDDNGRILVVLLDKKGVFNFNDQYKPVNRDSIDIDALKQAAMVDVTLFKALYPSREGEAYLQFIKGNQSSNFFKEALECGSSIENTSSVEHLFSALDSFSDEHNIDIVLHNNIQKKIEEKLSGYAKDKIPFSIDYVQSWIDECLADSHEAKGKFTTHVNVNGFQVNEWTVPTSDSILKAGSFVIEDDKKSYTCKINKGMIGDHDSDKKVKLTKGREYLMIPLSESEREEIVKRISKNDEQ